MLAVLLLLVGTVAMVTGAAMVAIPLGLMVLGSLLVLAAIDLRR